MTEEQNETQEPANKGMEENSNLEIWNRARRPPKEALKTIRGGRLSGMTDISPNWRYEVMTDIFGVCGIGWRYEIIRLWAEATAHEQILVFAEIKLFITYQDAGQTRWSNPIPGIGGSSQVSKEKSGLHATDECYKMAVTDALSTAMKMLGVAADIYAGLWDGSKYIERKDDIVPEETKNELAKGPGSVTNTQKKAIKELCTAKGMTKPEQVGIYKYALGGEQSNQDFATDFINNFSQYYDAFMEWQISQKHEDVPI